MSGARVTKDHKKAGRRIWDAIVLGNCPVWHVIGQTADDEQAPWLIAQALAEAEAGERERLEALRREFEAIWLRNWNEKFDPDVPLDETDQTRLHQIRVEFNNPRRQL